MSEDVLKECDRNRESGKEMDLHANGTLLERPPYVIRWDQEHNPLPVRAIRGVSRRHVSLPPSGAPDLSLPPWLETSPPGRPFDFGGHLRRLCADIASRCPELAHIDVRGLLFGVTQARTGHVHGLQARVTPLRFRHGVLTRRRRGILYQVQRYLVDDREILYVVSFCLPRFLDQDFDDKLVTLFHELYHIGPKCDGDLRRHGGRYSVHSHSQKCYDKLMGQLAREYLTGGADPALHAFLRLDFRQLLQRHGSVVGIVVPRPRLIPVPDSFI